MVRRGDMSSPRGTQLRIASDAALAVPSYLSTELSPASADKSALPLDQHIQRHRAGAAPGPEAFEDHGIQRGCRQSGVDVGVEAWVRDAADVHAPARVVDLDDFDRCDLNHGMSSSPLTIRSARISSRSLSAPRRRASRTMASMSMVSRVTGTIQSARM